MLKYSTILGFLLLWLSACDIRDNEIAPGVSFMKIYDNGDFERMYYPVDIRQTADSGYLVLGTVNLAETDFPGIYLMKIDRQGQFQWEHIDKQWVYAASELIPAGKDWQFFCMDKDNLGTVLLQADSVPRLVQQYNDIPYPLAAAVVPGGYLIQSYDRIARQTKLTKLNGTSVGWQEGYEIFEDAEDKVIFHLTRKQKPLPFFVGAAGGNLFFNGLNNFTLALTFINSGNGKQTGVLNGTRYESAVSRVLPLASGKFAVSRYKEDGENVYVPQAGISPGATSAAKDLKGNELPELSSKSRVIIRNGAINGRNVVFYLADTKNGQMALFAYEEASGALLGTRYLGAGNTFEAGNFTLTQDGGMAIAGRIYAAGRFPRICVFKLTKDDMEAITSGSGTTSNP